MQGIFQTNETISDHDTPDHLIYHLENAVNSYLELLRTYMKAQAQDSAHSRCSINVCQKPECYEPSTPVTMNPLNAPLVLCIFLYYNIL